MKMIVGAAICGALMMAACTTTEKVSVAQPGDRTMSCAELKSEFDKLDAVKADVQGDQGVNTANVAAVLFFWPAAARNYFDAREAGQLVEQRRAHLMEIYESKSCG